MSTKLKLKTYHFYARAGDVFLGFKIKAACVASAMGEADAWLREVRLPQSGSKWEIRSIRWW